MKTQVDIIGAGISGLASAYFLAKSSLPLQLRVWDRDSVPGGLAGSFSSEFFTIEKFYHHLYRRDVALIQLIEDINLDKRRRIKDEWNEIFYEILKPFLISKKVIPIEESAGVLFILKK